MTRDPLEIAAELERRRELSLGLIDEAAACIREMHAIVSRLPKTADGRRIFPGMAIWVIPIPEELRSDGVREALVDMITTDAINGHPELVHVWMDSPPNYGGYTPEHWTFATREAAEAELVAVTARIDARKAARTPEPTL